ncbi:MAG TPA: hypothetical protein VMR75_02580 [Candidatus Saccharimonadales bacterium]|nr:hypothetical protein [Candidatus Saccharimonadales bacterium]
MKLVATVFGPAFRWTKTSPKADAVRLDTYVVVIVLLMGFAISHVVSGAQGWHTTTGVVVKEGTKPIKNSWSGAEDEVQSLVQIQNKGRLLEKKLYLKWYKHDGAQIHPLWVKGTATRQSSPAAFRVVVKRPLLWALIGFVAVWIFWFGWDEAESAIGNYDERIARERLKEEDAPREAPTTIEAVEALCHANSDQEFEFYEGQNLKMLSRDILWLRGVYFPGRASASLESLSHLLGPTQEPRTRNTAGEMIISKLKEIGVVRSDFEWYQVDQNATAQII